MTHFTTTKTPDELRLQPLLIADSKHPHIHLVDMPYRLSSTWQDHFCEIGIWERGGRIIAWAVFQPAWWNLDYVIHPSERGSSLENDVLGWGIELMVGYSKRTGEGFYGSVEIFANVPGFEQTISNFLSHGFKEFDWSILRFENDLRQELPAIAIPEGYLIRPIRGDQEVETYIELQRAAFSSNRMTVTWRRRMLVHQSYRPEFDLVAVDPEGKLVGFCIVWARQGVGQIEPLGVHPEEQGKGLGKALVYAAKQVLGKSGFNKVLVDHSSLNKDAISLSLKMGFRQVNNALRYFREVIPDMG